MNSSIPALRQSDDDVHLATVDFIDPVFSAADRREGRRRNPGPGAFGAQGRNGQHVRYQRFEVVALERRHMISFCRSEQNPIDAAAEQDVKQPAAAEAK